MNKGCISEQVFYCYDKVTVKALLELKMFTNSQGLIFRNTFLQFPILRTSQCQREKSVCSNTDSTDCGKYAAGRIYRLYCHREVLN